MGIASLKRAVFLDRDGVLNEAIVRDGVPRPPSSLEQLRPVAGARRAIAALRDAGFMTIAVTNQPDVARGTARREDVEAINAAVAERLAIDAFYTCFHDDSDACDCRKPKPGLVLQAAREHGIDVSRSYFIGDRVKDVACGRAAGCSSIFIDYRYEETPADNGADATATSLIEAVQQILSRESPAARLRVKIFADGADVVSMLSLARNPLVKGFTTNPTLMRGAGVADYERFARELLESIQDRPVSFEVFSDDFDEMERQARTIASWGANVFVKLPVTNTKGRSTVPLIARLAHAGVKINVTAVMTLAQVENLAAALPTGNPSFVSVFAGRIADTGRDPVPAMRAALEILAPNPNAELIWASPRELLNVIQADELGVQVITMTHDLLAKLPLLGKDLEAFSLETVRMFHEDATTAGYKL
jgi:transaldolase